MITFRPLSQVEFDEYLRFALPHLASEIARSRELALDEATKVADASFRGLFPDGRVDSDDQFVLAVLHEEERVGVLHYGLRRDKITPYVYVWDIFIEPRYRGHGYGEAAMSALEREVKSLGISKIRLNVFGDNETARHLYEKRGFHPESIAMVKEIGA